MKVRYVVFIASILTPSLALLITFSFKLSKSDSSKLSGSNLIHSWLSEDGHSAPITIKSMGTLIDSMHEFQLNKVEVLSIVFPELYRYNVYQDVIETTADELIYVNTGTTDFSIGVFQMKPSFIELLEAYVTQHKITECNFILIDNGNVIKNRQERTFRLKQDRWQLRYAFVYWKVALHRFSKIRFQTNEDRIRFFATAYNYGFMKPTDEIQRWQTHKVFPYGSKYAGQQKAYADFAVEFYKTFTPTGTHL